MRDRRGYSLVEVLIVMTIGTALLGVAMSVLYMLKETETNVGKRLTEGRMVTRLADQFRADVHDAREVNKLPGAAAQNGELWQLDAGANGTVRYELAADSVRRIQTTGDKTTREDYRLPPGTGAMIRPPEPSSPLVTLRLEEGDATSAENRTIQIEAVLGLANRHSSTGP